MPKTLQSFVATVQVTCSVYIGCIKGNTEHKGSASVHYTTQNIFTSLYIHRSWNLTLYWLLLFIPLSMQCCSLRCNFARSVLHKKWVLHHFIFHYLLVMRFHVFPIFWILIRSLLLLPSPTFPIIHFVCFPLLSSPHNPTPSYFIG